MHYLQNWSLEDIFSGGSSSPLLLQTIEETTVEIERLLDAWRTLDIDTFLESYQEVQTTLYDLDSFILCLCSQDVTDSNAEVLSANFHVLDAKSDLLVLLLNTRLAELSEEEFASLLTRHEPLEFVLRERREKGQRQNTPEVEAIITSLSTDGFHGWGQMYDALINSINITLHGKKYSFGQVENMLSDPNRELRQTVFEEIRKAFDEKKTLFAQTLNHLAGYRFNMQTAKGYTQTLDEPLEYNRMEHETLASMWSVIEKHTPELTQFYERKAELLGVDKLAWYDLEAGITPAATTSFTYNEAVAMILECFEKELPHLATFSAHALEQRWVEAEDRPGKRPGGFCTGFPDRHESRIFMTFSGTRFNMLTLAHELGHAYHNFVTHPMPEMAQHFRMNVAETASIFAENIVMNATLEKATSDEEKIKILDELITRELTLLLNIRSRFLFEVAFYEERRKGYVSELRLSELMQDAQARAYNGTLSVYHPYFWAAKLHFFFSQVSFYNFPYTFGFLFSKGIYEMRHSFENFQEQYVSLLQDTGCMNVEALAQKHLEVDLTKPAFWEKSLAPVLRNISQFMELTQQTHGAL